MTAGLADVIQSRVSIVAFVVVLGLLIFVHELGHFLIAKRAGIRVEKFSLGFGPKVLGIVRGDTLYQISLIPLGGYVKLFGEEASDEAKDDPHSFSARSLGVRTAVVGAGPLMNLILAALIMPAVFVIGRSVPSYLPEPPVIEAVLAGSAAERGGVRAGDKILEVGGRAVSSWEEAMHALLLHPTEEGFVGFEPALFAGREAIIGSVRPGGPAEEAGLRTGDRVVRIDGRAVEDWGVLSSTVAASAGKPLAFELERDDRSLEVTIQPLWDKALDRFVIGIQRFEPRMKIREPVVRAVGRGWSECGKLTRLTFQFLGRLLNPYGREGSLPLLLEREGRPVALAVLFEPSPIYKSLGGPVRIAGASAAAARAGLADFLYFIAFLSLQLSILNVLPIPVLDGGHLAFFLWETIRGRPLSERSRALATQVGFAFLITLMVFVTVGDVDALWGWRELLDKMRRVF